MELPTTIEECHQVIRLVMDKLKEVDGMVKRIAVLEKENRELKERLDNNSSNSSLPPSKNTVAR